MYYLEGHWRKCWIIMGLEFVIVVESSLACGLIVLEEMMVQEWRIWVCDLRVNVRRVLGQEVKLRESVGIVVWMVCLFLCR